MIIHPNTHLHLVVQGANGVIQRLLTLNADWSNWLTDDFRQELENASPETIIELFGTHILVNTHLGLYKQNPLSQHRSG